MSINDAMEVKKSQNLNLLKIIAAFFVILSHSYSVCFGPGNEDWLLRNTRNGITFGGLAVAIFLFTSGFFVSKTVQRTKNARDYFKNRILRIFPPLIVIILVTTFIIGPIVTSLPLSQYFSSVLTYKYLLYIFMIPQYILPGVFENNPITLVNPSLWTLVLETLCYIGLFIYYKLGFLDKKKMKIMMAIVLCTVIGLMVQKTIVNSFTSYIRPTFMFFMGMFYYVMKDEIPYDGRIFIVNLLLLIVSYYLGYSFIGTILFLPYVVVYISFNKKQVPEFLGNIGNYSYGVYLVAYVVQQCLVHYGIFTNSILGHTFCAAVISLVLSIGLYQITDKQISRIK